MHDYWLEFSKVALAHLLFNVPLAVWILEGFMSGVPREIDETAYIDGYSFPRFFLTIFIPLIKAGVGVAAFFCFMFSWVELLMARTLTSVNAKPMASGANPCGARLSVAPRMIIRNMKVSTTSMTKPADIAYSLVAPFAG